MANPGGLRWSSLEEIFFISQVLVRGKPCQSYAAGSSKFLYWAVVGAWWSLKSEVRPFYCLTDDEFWLTICWEVKQSPDNYSGFILPLPAADQIITFYLTISELTNHSGRNVMPDNLYPGKKKVRYWMFLRCEPATTTTTTTTSHGGRWGKDKECRDSLYGQIIFRRIRKN